MPSGPRRHRHALLRLQPAAWWSSHPVGGVPRGGDPLLTPVAAAAVAANSLPGGNESSGRSGGYHLRAKRGGCCNVCHHPRAHRADKARPRPQYTRLTRCDIAPEFECALFPSASRAAVLATRRSVSGLSMLLADLTELAPHIKQTHRSKICEVRPWTRC